jgi:hypothetical protein
MASTSPIAVPSPYKSQRGWLIAFGVIEILIGCVFLLMILFSGIVFLGHMGTMMPPSPISPLAMMVFAGLQYGLMAAVFLTGGIGSIRCKNWARILMLVVSGLWLGFGLLTTLVMGFIFPTAMSQQPGNISPAIEHVIMAVIIAFAAFLGIILPAIFLFFYTHKSVRATCLAAKGAQPATHVSGGISAPALPIPLIILGVLQAIGSVTFLVFVFVMPGIIMFGAFLRGTAAVAVFLTYGVLSGYSAWMVFRQKVIGWQIAMVTPSLGLISTVITYFRRPGMLQLFREAGFNSQALRIYEQFPQMLLFIQVGKMVIAIVMIAFIVYTKRFFPKDESSTPSLSSNGLQ